MGKRKPKSAYNPSSNKTGSIEPLGRRKAEHIVTGRQRNTDRAKTAKPSVPQTYLVCASGDGRQSAGSRIADHETKPRTSTTIKGPPGSQRQKRSTFAATAIAKAKPSAKKPLTQPRKHPAHAQASCATNLPCRSANLSCGITGLSRGTDLPCRSSQVRKSGAPPVPPLGTSKTRSKRADQPPFTSSSRDALPSERPTPTTGTSHASLLPRGRR